MKVLGREAALAVIGVAAIGVVAATPAAAGESITAVSWGGAYTKSQIEAYYKPFTKKTGIVVHSADYNGGLAEIRAQVESGNVTWDIVDLETSDVIRGCDEGILMPIDKSILPPAPDGTPAVKDFIKGSLPECGVGEIVWSTVYAYDDTKFKGEKPKTIADFFDVKRFPGKRGMRKTPKVNIEWALMADGVPADKVYEVLSTTKGVERAFKVLDRIKDDVIWWSAGAQPPQMLADGEVAMTSAYNGRLFNAIVKEKMPFKIVWDGQLWDLDLWGIVKGAPDLKNTIKFLKFATDTQRLADQTKWISYGPVRKSSMKLVAPEMRPHMPAAPENFKNALRNNFKWWADHQDDMNERFAAWLAK